MISLGPPGTKPPAEARQGVCVQSHLLTQRLQPLVVDVSPDLLHVVPVRDNAVLQGVPNLQQAPELCCRLLPNEHLALQRACEDSEMLGPSHEGREVAFWQVVASEAGSYRAGPIVQHYWRVVQGVCHVIPASTVFPSQFHDVEDS